MKTMEQLRAEALAALAQLGFPNVFAEMYAGTFPAGLTDCRQRPEILAFEPWVAERFGEPVIDYIPLWEDNGNCILIYSLRDRAFYDWYLEGDDLTLIAKSYQQFITWLLLQKLGAGQHDAVKSLATVFDYRHLPELLAFATDTGAELDDESFIASIPD